MIEEKEDTKFEPRDEEIFRSYEHDGKTYDYVVESTLVAKLLVDDVLFIGYCETSPTLALYVLCNDLFAWACADAEEVTKKELPSLYRAHKSGPWGVSKWCCKRRNMQPQEPVIKLMKEAGAWDDEMEALPKNDWK